MTQFDYQFVEASRPPKRVRTGIFSAIRLVLAVALAGFAVYLLSIELFPILREGIESLAPLWKGGALPALSSGMGANLWALRFGMRGLILSQLGVVISPLPPWRWTLRYLHGATLSTLIAVALTQRQVEFYPLLCLLILNVLKGIFSRTRIHASSAMERQLHRLLNVCLLILAIANLLNVILYTIESRLALLRQLNEQRVNDLPSIP